MSTTPCVVKKGLSFSLDIVSASAKLPKNTSFLTRLHLILNYDIIK